MSEALRVLPFTAHHVAGAAQLLAARQQHARGQQPHLPALFATPEVCRRVLEGALDEANTAGVVALRGGAVAGFCLGRLVLAPPRPRALWLDASGHATAQDGARMLYRRMYAALATAFLARECAWHYALIPVTNVEAVRAWRELGFGIEQVHAIRPTSSPVAGPPSGATIRRGTADDLEAVMALAPQLPRLMAGAPVFGAMLPETPAALRAGHATLLRDPSAVYWLAEREGRVVAFQLWQWPDLPAASPDEPDGSIHLTVAVTDAAARGHGAGTALLAHGMAWAAASGARWCLADWRSANLSAGRFWHGHGFHPYRYRLARHVDERSVWNQPAAGQERGAAAWCA